MEEREQEMERALQSPGIVVSDLEVREGDLVARDAAHAGGGGAPVPGSWEERVVEDSMRVPIAEPERATVDGATQNATVERGASSAPSANGAGGHGAAPAQELQTEQQHYVVRSGDNLRKIAQRFYGDAMKWPAIRDANRDRLPNADIVRAGLELRIPTIR